MKWTYLFFLPYKHCQFIVMLMLKLGKFPVNAGIDLATHEKKKFPKKDTD